MHRRKISPKVAVYSVNSLPHLFVVKALENARLALLSLEKGLNIHLCREKR